MSDAVLTSAAMTDLLTRVEEATRSSEEGVKYFVEPAEDSLRRCVSRRHHIVFGRRGSGKSSVLRKAAADLTVDRRPIAWVDLEPFKGHSYPDLLISVLIKTFREFNSWLATAAVEPASKTSFWKRWFGTKPTRKPLDKKACARTSEKIASQLDLLESLLHSADDAEVEHSSEQGAHATGEVSEEAGYTARIRGLSGGEKSSEKLTEAESLVVVTREKYRRKKTDFLRRHIMDYQAIFTEMAENSGGDSFLFLDDLYHLRRNEQALVVDYFHSIAKGNRLWLKIGTIRHRSNWYVHGSPPVGMKLGDDADEIDLDLTLEKYSTTKQFLSKILANLAAAAGLSVLHDFLTDTGTDRLVLASGGVARDFLAIFRRSVAAARERGADSPRGGKVGAEDVNLAAGEHDTAKREEFKRDTFADEETSLDSVFSELRDFCLDRAESNCFLLEKDLRDGRTSAIHELVDLKLLHLIRSRVTINTRQGRIYEAYMLDLSQYAGSRKKRNLDLIEFWRPDAKDQLRKASLIYFERKDPK